MNKVTPNGRLLYRFPFNIHAQSIQIKYQHLNDIHAATQAECLLKVFDPETAHTNTCMFFSHSAASLRITCNGWNA